MTETQVVLTPEEDAALGNPDIQQPGDPTEMLLRIRGQDLAIIYQALDEGPGKFTRKLYGNIESQVREFVLATRRSRALLAKQDAILRAAQAALLAAPPPLPPNGAIASAVGLAVHADAQATGS